jgi:hypothetical protein
VPRQIRWARLLLLRIRINPDALLFGGNMTTLFLEKTITSYFDYQTVWADSNSVLATVNQQLINLPLANINDQHITLGSWNAEYLWQAKANHFMSSYQQIVKRHHILALQEVSIAGLSIIGSACDYNHVVSSVNSRGQAVGFLIHPRFHITNIHEYSELTGVFGIHDLRPALQIDVFDPQSKITLSIITIHLKSMLGGLAFTSCVRKKQPDNLVMAMGKRKSPTIILGDFNCFLDAAADINPLFNDGFNIANPHNHTSTQLSGGRLDGLFYKNLPEGIAARHYSIRNFWRASLAGRSLSDHGLLTWKLAKH